MRRKSPETTINNSEVETRDLSSEYFADAYPKPEKFIEVLEATNPELVETYQGVLALCERLVSEGGQGLLVGGSVRDFYSGLVPKDYDIEVYRIELDYLRQILADFGEVNEVGASFIVLKVTLQNGDTLDVSLPRRDSKVGDGHNDFVITADPSMSVKEAARRRDFTINSLAANPLTGEVFNYFDGLRDLNNKVLRVTDPKTFTDDALRVLRGAQFTARLDLNVDPDTFDFMKSVVPALKKVSKVRYFEEYDKLLIKGNRPSRGLQLLKDLGALGMCHPELDVLESLPQEKEWHPEGDVWKHTLMAVDAASEHLNDFGLDKKQKSNVMLATLCHDLGKATTTQPNHDKLNSEGLPRITSHGHEEAGEIPTKNFLSSIGLDAKNVEFKKIIKLVTEHLSPTLLYASRFEGNNRVKAAADGAIRRLAKRIFPATIRELVAVATADHLGRGPFTEADGQILINLYTAGTWLVREAERLGVDREPAPKLLSGKDLLILGFQPGENMGRVIALADNLRDAKHLTENDVLGEILFTKPEGISSSQDEAEVIAALEKILSTE